MSQGVSEEQVAGKYGELAKGLLVSVLILIMLEGLARIGFTVLQDLNERQGPQWYVQTPELGWEFRPGFEGSVYGVHRQFDSAGYISIDSAQIASDEKVKVLFLGDSNTFGVTVSTDGTFAQQLEKLMPNVSAINLGVPGYTSFQGYQTLLRKGLAIDPESVEIQDTEPVPASGITVVGQLAEL